MSSPEAVFKIVENNNCPLYDFGDEFGLAGQALLLQNKDGQTFITTSVISIPKEKQACRILIEDITEVLIKYENMNSVHRCIVDCSGCSGLIRLEYNQTKQRHNRYEPKKIESEPDNSALASLLYMFPIFQPLNDNDIKKLLPLLHMKRFAKGETMIKKGDPGTNLFIIVSGKAEVLMDDGTSIGYMERGDVFGEISLLIGTPAGATIRVVDVVTVILIYGKDFKKLLERFPAMQMYMARLLAERLIRTNDERAEDITSDMSGNLSENPPSELFQTLNLNSKTGILRLSLQKGHGKLVFKEGTLVGAQYHNKEGRDAFFEMLKQRKGRFKFYQSLPPEESDNPEIGDFMWLLMEGIRRMDEERNNPLNS
ncbi:DUF4388 domain-containing protein [Desulfobacterales bacterium HSG16]|nr:DUF4388 domain-containing protein [Desulfobacterales bacterium HSG16]